MDANGRPVAAPVVEPDRVITTLARNDRRVALVSHAGRFPDIEEELGPAVRLALENERLQAESLAHLDDLRASRTRIIETGDAERRRMERDLHDGAQQRLLAVSYDIRRALANAQTEGDTDVCSLLVDALDRAQTALDELRELAHGIYPAILGEAGLAPALASVADTARLRVVIRGVPEQRYPSSVETAVYLLVVEALSDAAHRRATHAVVTARHVNKRLMITVESDGSQRSSSMTQIADRVGALGGNLEVGSTVLRAKIPCA